MFLNDINNLKIGHGSTLPVWGLNRFQIWKSSGYLNQDDPFDNMGEVYSCCGCQHKYDTLEDELNLDKKPGLIARNAIILKQIAIEASIRAKSKYRNHKLRLSNSERYEYDSNMDSSFEGNQFHPVLEMEKKLGEEASIQESHRSSAQHAAITAMRKNLRKVSIEGYNDGNM